MDKTDCVRQVAGQLASCGVNKADTLLLGVSGGPDSVALLHILHVLRKDGVFAAHLHHGIRGQAASNDAQFVEQLCARWSIPLHTEYADVPAAASAQRLPLEAAAREARYACLRRAKQRYNAAYILTAHHMDDQAETVLLHLLRGSGLRGLCSMQPRHEDLVRPMLFITRARIMAYLEEHALEYCTDQTNFEQNATRNRLRLSLLPMLKAQYNPAIVHTLSSTAQLLSEDEAYLLASAREALSLAKTAAHTYLRTPLLHLPTPLQSRALRLAMEDFGVYDIQRHDILRLQSLLDARTGAKAPLPGGLVAQVSYAHLVFEKGANTGHAPQSTASMNVPIPFTCPGRFVIPQGVFVSSYASEYRKGEGPFVAYMDADKLPPHVSIRGRLPGDVFFPLGAKGHRKLKSYLIDKKLPRPQRERPLLACGADILFFPGGTIAHDMRVTDTTRRIVRVEYIEQNEGT